MRGLRQNYDEQLKRLHEDYGKRSIRKEESNIICFRLDIWWVLWVFLLFETPIPKANNLKVTIGIAELVSCNENSLKTNELKFEALVELSREVEGLIPAACCGICFQSKLRASYPWFEAVFFKIEKSD